jgi:hypothetical protein
MRPGTDCNRRSGFDHRGDSEDVLEGIRKIDIRENANRPSRCEQAAPNGISLTSIRGVTQNADARIVLAFQPGQSVRGAISTAIENKQNFPLIGLLSARGKELTDCKPRLLDGWARVERR